MAIISEGLKGTGFGHLTRCLSIYQAFEEIEIHPDFIVNCDEIGKSYLGKINLVQINWIKESQKLYHLIDGYEIAVIDSYKAPVIIYDRIAVLVKHAVYLDDYLRLKYPRGTIINGAAGAEHLPYFRDDQHQYLLGTTYTPLRKAFWDVSGEVSSQSNSKNILLILGGQDTRNLTREILKYLLIEFSQFKFHVVWGEKKEVERIKKENINYYFQLNADEMLNLMLKCDFAITAAGQTTYELARIGIPSVCIGTAENQKNNLHGWLSKGFIDEEIWYNSEELYHKIGNSIRRNLSKEKRRNHFLDGQGARRIIKYLSNWNENN